MFYQKAVLKTFAKFPSTGVFLWILRNFKNIYFEEYLQMTAPELTKVNKILHRMVSGTNFKAVLTMSNYSVQKRPRRCSVKKLFSKILQNLQKNICVFLWILENFWEHLFLKNSASGYFCPYNVTRLVMLVIWLYHHLIWFSCLSHSQQYEKLRHRFSKKEISQSLSQQCTSRSISFPRNTFKMIPKGCHLA